MHVHRQLEAAHTHEASKRSQGPRIYDHDAFELMTRVFLFLPTPHPKAFEYHQQYSSSSVSASALEKDKRGEGEVFEASTITNYDR